MSDLKELLKRRIVFEIDNMTETKTFKNLVYKTVADKELKMDITMPKNYDESLKYPAVVLVHGDGPAEILEDIKDAGQYVSLGQLLANSGFIAVTFNHRSSFRLTRMDDIGSDIEEALHFIHKNALDYHIDENKLGLWSISAGVPFGISVALKNKEFGIKCLIGYYGYLDLQHRKEGCPPEVTLEQLKAYSPVCYLSGSKAEMPPLFIVRAGLDHPLINDSIDCFIDEALKMNIDFDLCNHATGSHAFDIENDNARTHEIIRKTIQFLKETLE